MKAKLRQIAARALGIAATTLLAAAPGHATKNRAVWFWASPSSAYGAASIVGTPVRETQTLDFLDARGIKRVYGSYQNRPVTAPSVIAAWNTKLHDAGIESQFLMSENTWIFPSNRPGFMDKISARVIDFNTGRPAAEQFDALHLDIEPQALSTWNDLSPTEKRDHLNLLRDTYAAVRAHLSTNGLPDLPIYADLPVWIDSSSSIGWSSAAERDAWFAAISTNLTGVSLMPFDRATFGNIDSGVSWERANLTNCAVRIGLETDIGSSGTWPTTIDFNTMMQTLEANYGIDEATDIQAYALWRQALIDEVIGGVGVAIKAAPGTKQAALQLETKPGTTYSVLHSINFCDWLELERFRAPRQATTNLTIATTNQIGFYQIQQFIPIAR